MQKLPHQLAHRIIGGTSEEFDDDALLIEVVGLIETREFLYQKLSISPILRALVANISKGLLRSLLEKLFKLFIDNKSGLKQVCENMFAYGFYGTRGIKGAPAEVKSEKEREGKCFPYIPYDPATFLRTVNKIAPGYIREKRDFIDVGSGIGDKVLLANLLGFKMATGVEINAHTSQLAKHFLNVSNTYDEEGTLKLIEGDAFDLDFSEYSFIYMYRPIADEEILIKLHKKVLDEMPVGGYFIDIGYDMRKLLENYNKEAPSGEYSRYLYITKNTNDEKPHLCNYSIGE